MRSRKWPVRLNCLLLLVSLVLASALSVAPVHAQSTDLDRQVREIGADLRCPVCQNLSVADSPSPLAGEMRAIIRQKLEAGESREVIMKYFVASYGESVLLNPPQQGFTLLVWLGAAAALVGGGALLALRLRKALASRVEPDAHTVSFRMDHSLNGLENDPYEAALDRELEEYKQGVRL